MATEQVGKTTLGGVWLLSAFDEEDCVWALFARAVRVPKGEGATDVGGTPGVHAIRASWLRSANRPMTTVEGTELDYLEPVLEDVFVSTLQGSKVTLLLAGKECSAELAEEQHIQASGQIAHPAGYLGGIDVPPYVVQSGWIELQSAALKDVFKGNNVAVLGPVRLEPEGLVFETLVPRLDDPDLKIQTCVRLRKVQGTYFVELLPQRQSADAAMQWRAMWTKLRATLEEQKTAWLRADFMVEADLPRITWPVVPSGVHLEVKWDSPRLPDRITRVWLADQPMESQTLPPERVLEFAPEAVVLKVDKGRLTLARSAQSQNGAQIKYEWSKGEERVELGAGLALVHSPSEVQRELHRAYGDDSPARSETGFIPESRGWLALSFAQESQTFQVPARLEPAHGKEARGGLRLGVRRHDLHQPGVTVQEVPWRIQIDAPEDFSFKLDYDLSQPTGRQLSEASVNLSGCALRIVGPLWLAARKPDGDDALPRLDADPDAFFPVELSNCKDADASRAGFVLDRLTVRAPRLLNDQTWDAPAMRWKRMPSMAPGASLRIRTRLLDPEQAPIRGWFRHPKLPTITLMPLTRSNLNSIEAHASRSLEPYESKESDLVLTEIASLSPTIDGQQRAGFAPIADGMASPVLTLPGVATQATNAASHEFEGTYTLTVCTEPQARAVVPIDEEKDPPPLAPVVTARNRIELTRLGLERMRMAELAQAKDVSMFSATLAGTPAAIVPDSLAPPLTWTATATVSDIVDPARGQIGSVTFAEGQTWTWTASGDALLAGPPNAKANLSVPGKVSLGGPGLVAIVGWSLAETERDGIVRDGRGLSTAMQLQSDVLLRRAVVLGANSGELRSTLAPIQLVGEGLVGWRLAFTDLYFLNGNAVWPAALVPAAGTAFDACWTWSLWDDTQRMEQGPLSIGDWFQFYPAALIQIRLDQQGQRVVGCVIAGALGLGANPKRSPSDARCRVHLTFSTNPKGALAFSRITTPWEGNAVDWELGGELDFLGVGAFCLRGVPRPGAGGIELVDPSLTLKMLGSLTTVSLQYKVGSKGVLEFAGPAHQPVLSELSVAGVDVDMTAAAVTRLSADALLREGVAITVQEQTGLGAVRSAKLTWFGNDITFSSVRIDPVSRSFALAGAVERTVDVIPNRASAALTSAALAFSTGAQELGGFALKSLYFELVANCGDFFASHKMQLAAHLPLRDEVRLDGAFECVSEIGWPDLEQPKLDGEDSLQVNFAGRPRIRHVAGIHLSDHRIEGQQIAARAAGLRGMLLKAMAVRQPSATWLVEADHQFTWESGPQASFSAAVAMQLWSAAALATAIEGIASDFTFTASYRNSKLKIDDFPDPGVRRVRAGVAGLFGAGVVKALRDLGDAWVFVASGSYLVPDGPHDTDHLHVHLPLIAVMDVPGSDGYEARETQRRALQDALSVDPTVKVLRMSRHDLLVTPVHCAPDTAVALGRLAGPVDDAIPFVIGYAGAHGTAGSQLEAGFLRGTEACWHIEQYQPPGAVTAKPKSPFAFPRAAVMLAALRARQTSDQVQVLSILVTFEHRPSPGKSRVRLVSVEPLTRRGKLRDRHVRADLIVGNTMSIKAIALERGQEAAPEAQSRWLQAIVSNMSSPHFALVRNAEPAVSMSVIQLPLTKSAGVVSARFALRPNAPYLRNDGRRTWPEPSMAPSKAQLDLLLGARAHRRLSAVPSTSVHGSIFPSRLTGGVFSASLAINAASAATVWVQRNDEVAFAAEDFDVQDATPFATAGGRMVRSLVPSTAAVITALTRADPLLAENAATLQSYLPPHLYDFDQSDRSGAFSLARVRLLASPSQVASGNAARAFAGPTVARWMRLPRPRALPVNDGTSATWRRPVAWYGQPQASCLVLQGRWGAFYGIPSAEKNEVPAWGFVIGQPEPESTAPKGQDPLWRGSVRVRCFALGDTLSDAAGRVLALMDQQKASVRAGLRYGAERVSFERVRYDAKANGGPYLVFETSSSSPAITGERDCFFELALDVSGDLPTNGPQGVDLVALTNEASPGAGHLDPVGLHKIAIRVCAPRAGDFKLPLTTRTVFFEDPEYDLALSKVESASANGLTALPPIGTGERYQLWVDRSFVTPGETIVLRACKLKLVLRAGVKRRDAGTFENLQFKLSEEKRVDSVDLTPEEFVSLSISTLVNAIGALCSGDLLRLEARAGDKDQQAATVFIGVRPRSSLPTPEAMYSLLGFAVGADTSTSRVWCALHSSTPAADTLSAYQRGSGDHARLLRRARFRWETADANPSGVGFAVMKTHLPSESTHIPVTPEKVGP